MFKFQIQPFKDLLKFLLLSLIDALIAVGIGQLVLIEILIKTMRIIIIIFQAPQMKVKQQQQPGLFIKVTFKKETFNLGKNIKTYSDLFYLIKARFVSLNMFLLYSNEEPVTEYNFDTIMKMSIMKGQKSIKLDIILPEEKKVETIKQSKTKKYCFDFEEQKKTKKYSFNIDDFEHKEESIKQKQQLEAQFQLLTLNQATESQSQKQGCFDPAGIRIKVLIENQSESVKTEVGKDYYWSCRLINESQATIQNQLYVRDLSTKDLIQIKQFGVNQVRQIVFGPYTEKEAGKHTHIYQIVFKKDEKDLYPIGKKFGFVCDASKKIPVKSIQNKLYYKVSQLKSFAVSQKSTEYIIDRLKQIGINENSIQDFNDQDLIEIIESLNSN